MVVLVRVAGLGAIGSMVGELVRVAQPAMPRELARTLPGSTPTLTIRVCKWSSPTEQLDVPHMTSNDGVVDQTAREPASVASVTG